MIQLLVEHPLLLVIGVAIALCNTYLGFLASVVAEYRIKRLQGSFSLLYEKKIQEFLRAYVDDYASIVVAFIIYSHAGIFLLLTSRFGPNEEEKSTESRMKLK